MDVFIENVDLKRKKLFERTIQGEKDVIHPGTILYAELISRLVDLDALIIASRFSGMSSLVLGAAIEASLQIIGSYSLGVEESFQSGKHPCFPRAYTKRMTKFFMLSCKG